MRVILFHHDKMNLLKTKGLGIFLKNRGNIADPVGFNQLIIKDIEAASSCALLIALHRRIAVQDGRKNSSGQSNYEILFGLTERRHFSEAAQDIEDIKDIQIDAA